MYHSAYLQLGQEHVFHDSVKEILPTVMTLQPAGVLPIFELMATLRKLNGVCWRSFGLTGLWLLDSDRAASVHNGGIVPEHPV
jgi:hypothetical protein